MKFEQALQAMREGKKVTQPSKQKYTYIQNGTLRQNKSGDDSLITKIFVKDILAEDWEIVQTPTTMEELENRVKKLEKKIQDIEAERMRSDWQYDLIKDIYKQPKAYYK